MPGEGTRSSRPGGSSIRLAEQRLEDLLETLIERPHHRHTVENILARLDQLAADEIRRQEAESVESHKPNNEAVREFSRQMVSGRYATGMKGLTRSSTN